MPKPHTQYVVSRISPRYQSLRSWEAHCTCGYIGKPRGSKGVALRDTQYHRELQRIMHPSRRTGIH